MTLLNKSKQPKPWWHFTPDPWWLFWFAIALHFFQGIRFQISMEEAEERIERLEGK